MIRPVLVRALPNYRLYLEFSDGTKGEVDLSNLAHQEVFQSWDNPGFFEKVHIGSHREVKWNDEIELCADSLYLKLNRQNSRGVVSKTPTRATACLSLRSNRYLDGLPQSQPKTPQGAAPCQTKTKP